MIKAIFFDLGDVLTNNSFKQVLVKIAENLNLKYEDIDKVNKEYKSRMMVGEMSVKDISQIFKDRFNLSFTTKEIYDIWEKSYKAVRTINTELCDVAARLKKRYIVGMISNIYDLMAEIDRERGILDTFDPCILSCEVGLQKPGKEIFELALKMVNLKADECVFIDNKADHLIDPEKLGFHVILFENNKKTLKELNKFGIQII